MKTAYGGDDEYYEEEVEDRPQKKSNNLPLWGNEKTMNLNSLVLTNIQSSQYFKVRLFQLKTYHEVIDEIYYQVNHLEPWEKGSRVTAGQTGMCGGVRGVGAGGIVSTAFCILYKLFTLRLTRKQVLGLMNHADSPFIRGLGFMYIRFTQPPADLWDWFEPYLDDEEEIDVRAGGGGMTITIGDVVRHMLTKLDWYATLFPRIPVPIQKEIDRKLSERGSAIRHETGAANYRDRQSRGEDFYNGSDRRDRPENDRRDRARDDWDDRDRHRVRDRDRGRGDRSSGVREERDRHRERRDDDRSRNSDKDRRREKKRERSYDRYSSSSKTSHREHHRGSYAHDLEREKDRVRKERKRTRSRSRSRDRSRRHRRDY